MRFLGSIFSFVMFLLFAVCFLGYVSIRSYENPSDLQKNITFMVEKGDGVKKISKKLHENNIIEYPLVVTLFTYYDGSYSKIKAGEYEFPAHISPQSAMQKLVAGDTVKHKITVVEGKTVHDIIDLMNQNDKLTGEIKKLPHEGTLMPETYLFERGTDKNTLIKQMQKAQKEFLLDEWKKKAENLPIATPNEALILASIVEKETGIASERKRVASVFINRLRKGMRLQSDPTIIYGITKGKSALERPIYRSDILNDQGGYNTYAIDNLPPTPIANPSKEAIKAVLNPEETNYLFFVADGTGGHVFSETLQDHNDNVQKWRSIEKTNSVEVKKHNVKLIK